MSLFNPCKLTSDKLADLPIKDGQLIVTTDTKKLYVDVSPTTRIEVKSDAEVDLTDYVTQQVLTAALEEESSEREKQDNLLKDLINTKLDTSSADNRYALKNNPELTGDVSITNADWALGKITAAHPNNDDTDLTYYKYVIGFDSLHRPYFAKYEGETKVSTIYLGSDSVILDQPINFTDASGVGSNSSAANQTRINIGAAAANHTHDDKYYTETEVDNLLSSKANTSHTHTAANITDLDDAIAEQIPEIPTKLPNPAALTISLNGNSQGAYDGSAAKSIDVTATSVGAAAATHNHAASAITSGTFSLDRIPTITDAKISGISATKIAGTISSANLPSYVDDVLEYNGTSAFPEDGEAGKIYVDTSTNKTYRWSGSGYVEISASLALGTTSSTAFRGDYGNTAYQHATAKGSAYSSGLYKITTNNQGHVTAATAVTKSDITALGIPGQDTNTEYSAATQSTAGLMSAADKTKLDGIASGANKYTLPVATTSALGGVRIGFPESGKNYPVELNDNNQMFVNVPWTDTNTTYTLSSFGITATAAELNKLDGVTATAAELNYVDGVTSNIQTQLNGKAATSHTHSAATTSAAGFLPKLGGGTTNFLRADGTWAKPPDTNTNTTYTLTKSGSTITLTGSDGKTTSVTDSNTTYSLSSFGITATAAELNKLDGCTATVTELNYVDGVTSNIQTQLNGKLSTSGTAAAATKLATARTIGLSGDASGSVSFNGTANVNIPATILHHSSTSIPSKANLNSYTDPGWYYCPANATVATLSNSPTDNAFTMIVTQHAGTNQMLIEYMTSTPKMWIRNHYNSSWGSWYEIYHTGQKPTASEVGAAASSHNHSASNITSGTLAIARGGTGATTAAAARTALGITPANIGAAASSHTHSYLPLSGGTLTGTVTARTINPAADSTYNIGSSTVRYANIYADTFTGALSGNASTATTATQANYWTTARTLTFTGNVTGSVSVRGNANMSCALTLADDSVTSAKIAANAVGSSEIASGAVGLSELSSAVGTVAVQSSTPTDSHVKLWIKV